MAPTRTRRDVERVKAHDHDFEAHGTVLAARMKAVVALVPFWLGSIPGDPTLGLTCC